nr:uncharacterized protein LOC129265597 [Lytechinus pictus]
MYCVIGFTDTFKESEDFKGFECNGLIYKYTHLVCYGFLALVFTPMIAFFWALFFASLNHGVVWCIQPCYRTFYIACRLCHMHHEFH